MTSSDDGELQIQLENDGTLESIATSTEFVSDSKIKLEAEIADAVFLNSDFTRFMQITLFPINIAEKNKAPEIESRALINIELIGTNRTDKTSNFYKSQLLCVRDLN